MTPLMLQLAKSVAIVVGAGIILQRFKWREYPALFCFCFWEVAMQSATLGFRNLPTSMQVLQDVVCGAVICEVICRSRLAVQIGAQIRVFVCAVAAAKILASVPRLTAIQEAYLFRSYVLLAAFGVLLAITVLRWRKPMLERKADGIYRLGATAWVGCLAVSGSFVRGGLGYILFPRTMATWLTVHTLTCLAISATVIGMAVAMHRSVPGRKRAAMSRQGKARTGLIETARAA